MYKIYLAILAVYKRGTALTVYLPLNIWKLDAYVRVSPTYISEVPHMSHMAAGRKMRGLKFWLPMSIFPTLVSLRSWNTIRQENSPRNMPTAWKMKVFVKH